jgi:plastocyanin
MRHLHWRVSAAALALGLIAVAGCGDDDDDASSAATTAATTAASTSGGTGSAAGETWTVKATEPSPGHYVFEGVPETTEAGIYTIDLENTGQENHDFGLIKIDGTHTPDELVEQVIGSQDGGPIPDWVVGATGVGDTNPGGSATATVKLTPGTYIYFCSDTDAQDVPHAKHGMEGTLTVTGDETGDLPSTDATVKIVDYGFQATGLKSGQQTVTVENTGAQFHHIVALPLAPGATLEDAKAFLLSDPSGGSEGSDSSAGTETASTSAAGAATTTAATEAEGPPPVDFEHSFSTAVVGPGESLTTTFDLTSGKYVFLCFISDKAGGPPHAIAHDMITEVDIT